MTDFKTTAEIVDSLCRLWPNLVGGDYQVPECPPPTILKALLDSANFASGIPEEGRYPRFNLVAAPRHNDLERTWRFSEARPLDVQELRRLLPATDPEESALLVEWIDERVEIVGVQNFGASWRSARIGFDYRYRIPRALILEVERPNRILLYQGEHLMATLSDGQYFEGTGYAFPHFLTQTARVGLADLERDIKLPQLESERLARAFAFAAFSNCFLGLANSISLNGHGGAIIVVPSHHLVPELELKYPMNSSQLSKAFLAFLNLRNQYVDAELSQDVAEQRIIDAELVRVHRELVDTIRLVAGFSACDGAIAMSRDLRVLGFGCEISSVGRSGRKVFQASGSLESERHPLDVEQFGMRHRSAIKLVSQHPDLLALVVSQDGPVTGIWAERGNVLFRAASRLANANFPWV